MEGKYSIELFRDGGEGAGIEKILVRHDSLTVARALYKVAALNCSERLIMLCDRARVLARSESARDNAGNKGRSRSQDPLNASAPAAWRMFTAIRRASLPLDQRTGVIAAPENINDATTVGVSKNVFISTPLAQNIWGHGNSNF